MIVLSKWDRNYFSDVWCGPLVICFLIRSFLVFSLNTNGDVSFRYISYCSLVFVNWVMSVRICYILFQMKKLFYFSEQTEKIHCYYQPKCFQHFLYIRDLLKTCKTQVDRATKNMVSNTELLSDVMIKITFIGDTSEENLRLVSERRGNTSCQSWNEHIKFCFLFSILLMLCLCVI